MNTDDRIAAALAARANLIHSEDLTPADPPLTTRSMGGPHRWTPILLAAAAVVVIAVGASALAGRGSSRHTAAPAVRTTSSTVSHPPMTTAITSPPSPRPTTRPTPPPSGGTAVNCYFIDFRCPVTSNYVYRQPLWPFASWAAAKQWENVDGPAGHQPWHADAGQTALAFARSYLGFTDITMVTSTATSSDGAQIGVGYRNPAGALHTSAVLHLVRYTDDPTDTKAPWEVVSSDQSVVSIERPTVGSTVTSPMTVGGHITGVDEQIVVSVRTLSGQVTTLPGIAAGGTFQPWSETVTFPETGVLTIVASTGGHVSAHESFVISGVRTG